MKKLISLTIVIATIFGFQSVAQAGDKERALIGGLIGGAIIASALNDNDHHHRHNSSVSVSYSNYGGRDHGHRCGNKCGYYKDVRHKYWVSGHWDVSFDDCGRRNKRYISGHYDYSVKRVWVAQCSYRSASRHSSSRYNDRDRRDRHDSGRHYKERYSRSSRHDRQQNCRF